MSEVDNVLSLPACPGCGWVLHRHEQMEFMSDYWHPGCAELVVEDLNKVLTPVDFYPEDDEVLWPTEEDLARESLDEDDPDFPA